MRISVSSYSFSQYIRAGKLTMIDCIAAAKEIGFEAIEFINMDGATLDENLKNAEAIRKKAEELSFPIISYTIGANLYNDDPAARKAEVERLKGQLTVAKELGVGIMRHDVCYTLGKKGPSRSFDGMLPYLAESAREVTEYAATLGIRTCSENHGYIAQDSDRVERLVNAVAHDNYGLLVDIGNFICVDEDPRKAVSRVAPYAFHVHAKDFRIMSEPDGCSTAQTRGCNYFCGTAVGEGDIPVKKCLEILKRAGYEGDISIEFEGLGDCIDSLRRGRNNLENYLKQIGWRE